MRKASQFDENDKDIIGFIDKAAPFVLRNHLMFPDNVEARHRHAIGRLHNSIGLALRALLEVRTIAQDVTHIKQMLKRYPWSGTGISRSKHIELTWFTFVNLCYLFEEKVKRFYEQSSRIRKMIGEEQENWIKGELASVRSGFGRHIRNRGEIFHEWGLHNDAIKFYGMIEILTQAGNKRAARNNKHHFSDTRMFLKLNLDKTKECMVGVYLSILSRE